MKRKNYALRAWKAQQTQREKDSLSRSATKAKQMRAPGNKDIPAFHPGGGSGCRAHRKARSFARAYGHRMGA